MRDGRKYSFTYTPGPFEITVEEKDGKIVAVFFDPCGEKETTKESIKEETTLLKEAGKQLAEYFAGSRKDFDLPLGAEGTPFQQRVWNALLTIPYGETRSYQEIAVQVGNPKACRAVGMANNRNPIGIIVPCHRVVGKNGSLTGYAGGLDKKEYLLFLERKNRWES